MFLQPDLLLSFLGPTELVVLALVCILLTYLYYIVERRQSYWDRKGIKYIPPRFILGNLNIIPSRSFFETTQKLYNFFPEERYHGIYQFLQPTLIIKDPNLIKEVTVKAFDHFTDRRDFVSEEVDPFWGKNLFASNGERWRDLRTTLSPAFTGSKMRIMFGLMEDCAKQLVAYLEGQTGVIELEMKDTFSRYTNDVIATTAFGLKIDSLKDPDNDFYQMGKKAATVDAITILKFFMYGISPTLSKLLGITVIPKKVSQYFTQIIEDTVRTRKEKNIVRPDMIHLLIEAQKSRQENSSKKDISSDDIVSQAFIFFLAGFETVSSLLTFTFYELAQNPEIQDRLRKEMLSISGQITYEALLDMKYLDMVVSEGLRKWPSAGLTDRKVTKAYTIEPQKAGEVALHLEEGVICWLPMFAIQHDPRHFSAPEKFDPERFNEENKHKIDPAVYLPFGLGPRICIGSRFALVESKLIMYYILKNFEVVTVERTPNPLVLDKGQINLAAKGGMWLGLKKL